jgi:hypothetical protein
MVAQFSPTDRVHHGEVIIFQNNILYIFKEMIKYSTSPLPELGSKPGPLKPEYVIAVILEFQRTLLEF